MLQIQQFTFNALQEHTYIAYDTESKACCVIDPGCYERYEEEELSAFIAQQHLHVKHLVNMHCHLDHSVGNAYVIRTYKVPLAIHHKEQIVLQKASQYAKGLGMPHYQTTAAEVLLEEGDTIAIGNIALKVIWLPGHSPGHIGLYNTEKQIAFTGDVLFQGSIGRTDLPGGDQSKLLQSIQQKLVPLADSVTIYPGHGPTTTIGKERASNPYWEKTSKVSPK